jgi:hypothetical protein
MQLLSHETDSEAGRGKAVSKAGRDQAQVRQPEMATAAHFLWVTPRLNTCLHMSSAMPDKHRCQMTT